MPYDAPSSLPRLVILLMLGLTPDIDTPPPRTGKRAWPRVLEDEEDESAGEAPAEAVDCDGDMFVLVRVDADDAEQRLPRHGAGRGLEAQAVDTQLGVANEEALVQRPGRADRSAFDNGGQRVRIR